MQVVDVRWFCSRTNVGIVRVKDNYDGVKYFISACEGKDAQQDIKFIADWGSAFPTAAGDLLFSQGIVYD